MLLRARHQLSPWEHPAYMAEILGPAMYRFVVRSTQQGLPGLRTSVFTAMWFLVAQPITELVLQLQLRQMVACHTSTRHATIATRHISSSLLAPIRQQIFMDLIPVAMLLELLSPLAQVMPSCGARDGMAVAQHMHRQSRVSALRRTVPTVEVVPIQQQATGEP